MAAVGFSFLFKGVSIVSQVIKNQGKTKTGPRSPKSWKWKWIRCSPTSFQTWEQYWICILAARGWFMWQVRGKEQQQQRKRYKSLMDCKNYWLGRIILWMNKTQKAHTGPARAGSTACVGNCICICGCLCIRIYEPQIHESVAHSFECNFTRCPSRVHFAMEIMREIKCK